MTAHTCFKRAAPFIAGALMILGLAPRIAGQLAEIPLNADGFFDTAQVVALGRVTNVSFVGHQQVPGPRADVVRRVTIDVRRCYEAPVQCPAQVSFDIVAGFINAIWIPLAVGDTELVFLQDTPNGLLPVDNWAVWQPLQMTALPSVLSPLGRKGLKIDLAVELASPDPRVRMQGLYYLRLFQHPLPEDIMLARGILLGPATSFLERLYALAFLLTDPQPEDIAVAADFAEQHADEVKQNARLASPIGGGLALARTPGSIPDLIRIAKSPVEWWHAGALTGLRKIANPIVIPFLVSVLDDPDPVVAYIALITLAEMTKKYGDFGPGRGLYDKDPQKYIALWKHWWETEGRAEYGTVADQQAH
jgi:hypothetical protein